MIVAESATNKEVLAPALEHGVARMGDRSLAAFLDGAALIPVFVIAVALAALRNHIPASTDGSINLRGGPALEAMFYCTVAWCLYCFIGEAVWGRTLGKEIMAIEVRSDSGEKCGVGEAFLRNMLRPIDGIGFYLLGFVVAISSPRNQRIGDRIAGTVVTENPKARRVKSFLLWILEISVLSCGALVVLRFVPRG
jgi:uncharacterized RDD family membrane protein YckC